MYARTPIRPIRAYLDEIGVMSFFPGLQLAHDCADQVGINTLVEEVVIQHFYRHILSSPMEHTTKGAGEV